jgi:ligand-binding SRPBCC domain-containing protein
MVHVTDDGVFDAPLEKIWRFLNDENGHQHSSVKFSRVIEQSDKGMTSEVEVKNPDGSWRKETWEMRFNPPTGFSTEVTSGPMKGTKHRHAYTPMGDKTKVVVEGEFIAQGMDDAALKRAALTMFEQVFNEDIAHLKNYK